MNETLLRTAYDRAYNHFCDIVERSVEVYNQINDDKLDVSGLAYDTLNDYNLTHEEIEDICNGTPSEGTMYKFLAIYLHYADDLYMNYITGGESSFDKIAKDPRKLHAWLLSNLAVDLSKDDINKIHYEVYILQASMIDRRSRKKKLKLKKSAVAATAIFAISAAAVAFAFWKKKHTK